MRAFLRNGAARGILAAAATLCATAAHAQDNPAEPYEVVVVTGTSTARTALKTPMQTTVMDSDKLEMLTSSSPADLLTTIPTLKAEGGGGEVATNVFVAGLPSTGQYQFTPLEFNGMPVVSSTGLNSSAPDIFERPDLGVERLEFVHGGVSNLFGGGSVGGLINYIDKHGTDQSHGEAKLELSDHDRIKTDFAANGPIDKAAGLYYAVSGWYRYDKGPLYSGNPSEGEQVRGNIRKEFDSGYVTVYGQFIDDKDQFYGDYPLTGSNFQRPVGNNGKPIYTTETSAIDNISFMTPNGLYRTKVSDGVLSDGGAFGLDFKKDFGDGWGANGRMNVASYKSSFALYSGGDGKQNLPTTQSGFLQAYGYNPANYTGNFTYAQSGQTVPSSSLLWSDRVIDRDRPLQTQTAELNLTKTLTTDDWTHNLTLGGFWGHSEARDRDVGYGYIGDFDNAPQLVNITATNKATGATTVISQNGLLNTNISYTNNWADARRYAGYVADQTSFGRWELDAGARIETINGSVSKEGTQTYAVNTTPGLSPLLSNVLWGNNIFTTASVETTAYAFAGAALYRLTDQVSLFANASHGYFMPQMNSVVYTATAVQSYQPELINQVEAGAKYSGHGISANISPFFSTLSDLRNVSLLNNSSGGVSQIVNTEGTRTYGVETAGRITLPYDFYADGNLTYQHDEYTQYTPVGACNACVGNQLLRQPAWAANLGLYYNDDEFDVAVLDNFTGSTYTSDLNNVRMPSFNVWRLEAGYTRPLANGDALRINLSVYNLFDSQAVTEGNPRQGTLQNAGAAYFVGRTVLPRRISLSLSYKY